MTVIEMQTEAKQIVHDRLLIQKAERLNLLTPIQAAAAKYGILVRMEKLEEERNRLR